MFRLKRMLCYFLRDLQLLFYTGMTWVTCLFIHLFSLHEWCTYLFRLFHVFVLQFCGLSVHQHYEGNIIFEIILSKHHKAMKVEVDILYMYSDLQRYWIPRLATWHSASSVLYGVGLMAYLVNRNICTMYSLIHSFAHSCIYLFIYLFIYLSNTITFTRALVYMYV